MFFDVTHIFKKRKSVSRTDHEMLMSFVHKYERLYPNMECRAFKSFIHSILDAKVVDDNKLSAHTIKMYSRVSFEVTNSGKRRTIQLVYPHEQDLKQFKLSVFSAIGMSIFAQKVGSTVSCFENKRKIIIKITDCK